MIRHRHRATRALIRAHGEVLAERRGTHDGGLVDLRVLADFVGGAVAGDGADDGGAARAAGVVAVVLDDVVFGQRAVEPAVDGVVGALICAVGALEGDAPVRGKVTC